MEPWKGERGRGRANKAECRRRSSSAPPGKRMQELTPRERRVTEVRLFVWLAMADVDAYIAMTEDEVEEEYRRAGKLHRYDPDKEWEKRLARLARKWPPPDGFIPEIDEHLKLLDDDDRDEQVQASSSSTTTTTGTSRCRRRRSRSVKPDREKN